MSYYDARVSADTAAEPRVLKSVGRLQWGVVQGVGAESV